MRSAKSAGLEASMLLKAVWAFSYFPSCIRRRADSYWQRVWARDRSPDEGATPASVRGRLEEAGAGVFIEVLFLSA
jgi:hypothetical protein